MPQDWSGFEEVEGEDPWSGFETVGPAPTPSPRSTRQPSAHPALPPPGQITGPVDGDTLRLDQGPNLRLFGVDAPELNQQGWTPQGRPMPVGTQARDAVADYLSQGAPAMGPVQMQSYGRPVAPVDVSGRDLGLSMARGGWAFAAPEYMRDDPERRFEYMQAERLARLNGLGVHDYNVQRPQDFRRDVPFLSERHTEATAWDRPTQSTGLSATAEHDYVRLLQTGTKQQIMDFVTANGFRLDEGEVDGWIRGRETFAAAGQTAPAYVTYAEEAPRPLTDMGDGATGAGIRGTAGGFLMGGLDEAGAVVDALGGTDGRESVWNSDRRFADIWLNNQRQNASILGYDEAYHPYASYGGQVVGAVGGGLLLPYAAGARTVGELATVGSGLGALGGFLETDGSVADRATGAVIGSMAGAILEPSLVRAAEALAPMVGRGFAAANARLRAGSRATPDAPGNPAAGADAPMGTQSGQADEWADFETVEPAPAAAGPAGSPDRAAMAMDGEAMPSVSQAMPQQQATPMAQRLTDPRTQAQIEAQAAQLQPRDVLPIPGNEIADAGEAAARDAGRFEQVRIPNERGELTRRTLRGYFGNDVPVVGPVDMVGWLRLNGGLREESGALAHMGIRNNAARTDMDFIGQETKFGPLVNEGGMTLEDAGLRAWEEGYFPELTERPTTNEFLDALRETYDGRGGRRFVADDLPEIENYYGRQSDRYAIQQQEFEQGAPVVRDLSEPADEPQPFAPPEAYEEWPAGGPDFAGNIRLDRLESPQDISRALAQTEARVGFDAATRGRVTQAETERLAGELNMTPEQLLSRRRGQALNAEEALAARQLLAKSGNELVNAARRVRQLEDPGDELLAEFRQKWMRHVAIQEQVSGMTAEAGRALQQFRMAASSRAVNRDVLAALVKGGGGRDRLLDAAETILDASESAPGVFNTLTDKLARPRFRDKIMELYINMLLSGPQTHAVNIASNTLTTLAQLPEFATAAGIGRARQVLAREQLDRIVSSEVGARAFGLLQGAREGLRMFAQALRTGEASDFVSKVEGDQFNAISGLKGEVIRVPTRLLTAEDELFKGVARRMELNAQAVRTARREGLRGDTARARIAELSANPTDDMMEAALEYGRYLTFQRQLGPVASKVSALTNDNPVIKVFLPFVRTPTNLIKFAVERSPAAPLLREWRKEFMAGGASRDLAIARASLGTGMGMLVYQAALAGHITGSAPSDPAKARLLYADGWKPNSIKIGDTYYSYRRLDPFSSTLGVAADLATMGDNMSERQQNDRVTLLVASIMGNLASKTWLSGISDLMGALDDPERNAGTLLERLAGSFTVPTGVNQVARLMDPVARETDSMGEAIRNRIPGLSQDLLPRRDIWGREIVNEGGLGPDIVSPVWQSQAANDPVNLALMALDYAPGYPSRKVGGQELSPEDYDAYLAQSGQGAHDSLSELVASPDWEAMTDDDRIDAARRVVREARATAREELFSGSPAATDEWADFEAVD
jgi:endonuclease YncB( thermonuclease family)